MLFECRWCHEDIHIKRVRPGEDDTEPWRVVAPGHSVRWNRPLGVKFRCPTGVDCVVQPQVDEGVHIEFGDGRRMAARALLGSDPDHVDHETWLEYHNRLIREYYDFDAEWALIKEICPEVEKAAPKRDPVLYPLARGIVAAVKVFTIVSVLVLIATFAAYGFIYLTGAV